MNDFKFEIYFLKNIFSKDIYAFCPHVTPEYDDHLLNFGNISQENKDELQEHYNGINKLTNKTIVKIVNIQNYNVVDLKNYIHTFTDIDYENQLLYIKTNNKSDYSYRIQKDNLEIKSNIEEPLGFYYGVIMVLVRDYLIVN